MEGEGSDGVRLNSDDVMLSLVDLRGDTCLEQASGTAVPTVVGRTPSKPQAVFELWNHQSPDSSAFALTCLPTSSTRALPPITEIGVLETAVLEGRIPALKCPPTIAEVGVPERPAPNFTFKQAVQPNPAIGSGSNFFAAALQMASQCSGPKQRAQSAGELRSAYFDPAAIPFRKSSAPIPIRIPVRGKSRFDLPPLVTTATLGSSSATLTMSEAIITHGSWPSPTYSPTAPTTKGRTSRFFPVREDAGQDACWVPLRRQDFPVQPYQLQDRPLVDLNVYGFHDAHPTEEYVSCHPARQGQIPSVGRRLDPAAPEYTPSSTLESFVDVRRRGFCDDDTNTRPPLVHKATIYSSPGSIVSKKPAARKEDDGCANGHHDDDDDDDGGLIFGDAEDVWVVEFVHDEDQGSEIESEDDLWEVVGSEELL